MVKTEQTVSKPLDVTSQQGSPDWSGACGPDGALIPDRVIFRAHWFP